MLSSFFNSLKNVIIMTYPTIIVSLVVLISVRISYLIRYKEKFVLYKEIFLLLFAFYVLCLFQVVTLQDINLTNGNNFIPFSEILRYRFGSRLFVKNIFGNVIMFVPYGFFLGKYAIQKNYKVAFFLVLLASLSIELTQLLIGRIFDIDDIILNVIGGFIGYLIYRGIDNIYNKLPDLFRKTTFLNIVSMIALIVFGFIIYRVVV